jgi:urease accessory protein
MTMTTITMTMITPIATEAALYRLMTWLSPAFPVGGFSYSHALETAVEAGLVRDRAGLEAWVAAIAARGAGRADASLFCAVWRGVTDGDAAGFLEAAELAAALRGTSELARESAGQGAAFLMTVQAAWPDLPLGGWVARLEGAGIMPAYCIAVALAASLAGVPLAAALTAFLQGFAANLVSAGVRLVPLGQTDGQRVTAALEPVIAAAVAAALSRAPEDLGSAAPMVDLLSMRHEVQYTRLFRS